MPQAIDEAGNIWEVDARGNPVRFVGQAGAQAPQPMTLGSPSPKAPYEAPAAAAQLEQTRQNTAIAAAKAERERREWEATHFPDGTPKPEAAKPASVDPDRIPQVLSALENIKRLRELSKKSLAVGGYSESAKNLPLLGGFVGQHRRDVEGALQMVQGDLIQQQIAKLSQMNGGKGVASIANSESEAARMAASIANLDPNQNLAEFTRGLDRAEQFYRRQIAQLRGANINDAKVRKEYGISTDGTSPAFAPAVSGGMTGSTRLESNVSAPDQLSLATGSTKTVPDPKANALITRLIRAGVSDSEINAALNDIGAAPVTPDSLRSIREFEKKHPGSSYSGATRQEQTSLFNQIAASPAGTFLMNAGIAGSGGLPVLLGGQQRKQAFDLANEANPKAAFAGNVAGGIAATVGGGKLLGATKLAPMIARNPRPAALLGDVAYGGGYGFNTADEGNRTAGTLLGAGGALLGNQVGSRVLAPAGQALLRTRVGQAAGTASNAAANVARRAVGRPYVPFAAPPEKLSSAATSLIEAVGDPSNLMPDLQDAQRLGVPFTIADANAATRALAGAASRRSPNTKALAETTLIPRGRGQFDRLQGALDRDTVPGTNIPQQSEALIKKARQDSGPLYQTAFDAPGASAVDLSDLSTRPGFQKGLERARGLAAEEGVDPTSLGFDFDADGNVVLTRVPSFRTLDYVKRGLDDEIYGNTDAFGRPVMTDATRALEGTRAELVRRLDAVNPDYAAARAAYAGPAKEREAFHLGTQSVNQTPDNIRFTLEGQTPAQQGQYRLGYRSALDDRLGNIRYAANPWETAFGSPNAQERMGVLFPNGAPRFGRQYDLESRMAQTQRDVLGNSMTAERQLADQSFGMSPGAAAAVDGALALTTGAPPVATGLRLWGQYGKDALKLGFGKKKAEELGPMLFAPLDIAPEMLAELEAKRVAYEAARSASRRRGGIFGRAAGATAGANLAASLGN